MESIDWLVQEYALGGFLANYTEAQLAGGFYSPLVTKLLSTSDPWQVTSSHDETWMSGDAIIYSKVVAPFLAMNPMGRSSTMNTVTVNTGELQPDLAGKIMSVNNVTYPNIMFTVADGTGSSVALPWRCSPANFVTEDVYTSQHGYPQSTDDSKLSTLTAMNMQVMTSTYNTSGVVCDGGEGTADCSATADLTYNSFTQNQYTQTSGFFPSENCGTRVFAHGNTSMTTTIDEITGMTTGYVATTKQKMATD